MPLKPSGILTTKLVTKASRVYAYKRNYYGGVMKKNQNGFTLIETLLILIMLLLICFAGWWVWQSKNKTEKTLESTSNSSQSTQPMTKYLSIKEWSIKLPLSDKLLDAYYSSPQSATNYDSIGLSVTSLDPDCSASHGDLGILFRQKSQSVDAGAGNMQKADVKINGYYYGYRSYQGTSCTNLADKLSDLTTAFTAAAKNLQAE